MKKINLEDGQFIVITNKNYAYLKRCITENNYTWFSFFKYITDAEESEQLDTFDFDIDDFEEYNI